MGRRVLVVAALAVLSGLAWWHDRAPRTSAGDSVAKAPTPTPPGGPFRVLIEAPAGRDLRVVRDRQKVHDRPVGEEFELEVDAFEWVTVRVDEGEGVLVSWRAGGTGWSEAPPATGAWEMTVLKSGARIVVFLDREPPSTE